MTAVVLTIAAFSAVGYSFALYGLNILAGLVENARAGVFVNPTHAMPLLAPIVLPLVTPLEQKAVAAFTFLAAGVPSSELSFRSKPVVPRTESTSEHLPRQSC